MPKIITIAREYGSGGRIIAQKVANLLGIVYYDNQIIDLAAQELGFVLKQLGKHLRKRVQDSFMEWLEVLSRCL